MSASTGASTGLAGRVARAFLHSKLTPLVTMASLFVGAIGLIATPREEEPQISVPMIDVFAGLPGASSAEVEQQVIKPLEQALWEVAGVEYVYSMASDGGGMVTARFAVGADQTESVAKVHAKVASQMDRWPMGAPPAMVKPHAIDDVPILALTISDAHAERGVVRQVAAHMAEELRTVPDVAQVFLVGGEPRQVSVRIEPARLAATGVSPGEIARALMGANSRMQAGEFAAGNEAIRVDVTTPFASASDVGDVIVAVRNGQAIALRDVAVIEDGFAEPSQYVTTATKDDAAPRSAVTIAVAKRPGANATTVANAAVERIEQSRGRVVPEGMRVDITRDYGETAAEKASELILHLGIATLSVTLLVWWFLGWREAVVVLVAVPVTLALTLFVYYLMGYTLNRITLFALIFSIGILVDDAIVVVENIARHVAMRDRPADVAAVEAVDEVGNPTILATFTVIAAILPMMFVSGLMGPYMRPIPVGASVAMLASLGVAFIVTPWLGYRLLKGHAASPHSAVGHGTGGHAHEEGGEAVLQQGFGRFYKRLMMPLIERRSTRMAFYAGTIGLLAASMSLMVARVVQVKMLPFDNKSEFQVVLDFPETTTLETTLAASEQIASALRTVPEVVSTQVYAGTSAPFNFNGLVRHYFLRRGANVSDIQVNLAPKHDRSRQSHAIAVAVRPMVDSIARTFGASAKVAEIPPGPPVLSTLVAEIYADNEATRLEAAQEVKAAFEATAGVVDVDWTVEAPAAQLALRVDRAAAARAGADVPLLTQTVAMAVRGMPMGALQSGTSREPVLVVPRLDVADRSSIDRLLALPVTTASGPQPLGRFVSVDSGARATSRHRKNLRPVIYVTGDVAGEVEAPVYAILALNQVLDTLHVGGATISRYNAVQPDRLDETAVKWDGEWQVTIEVFRDLGIAFAVVLILIYVLVVAWFQSFTVPLVIMAPIPLTMVGILPAHAVTGAFFTATSMIGMIALAGIIVRNSILLVDFIQLAEERGTSLVQAVLEAGAVRFRPIALTAAAVVIGGLVMVLDPIFQGLAVALIGGAIVATLLTMVVVPLLYWELRRREEVSSDVEAALDDVLGRQPVTDLVGA
jgi:multidrug efflux pump subunit AcrB